MRVKGSWFVCGAGQVKTHIALWSMGKFSNLLLWTLHLAGGKDILINRIAPANGKCSLQRNLLCKGQWESYRKTENKTMNSLGFGLFFFSGILFFWLLPPLLYNFLPGLKGIKLFSLCFLLASKKRSSQKDRKMHTGYYATCIRKSPRKCSELYPNGHYKCHMVGDKGAMPYGNLNWASLNRK